MNKKSERLGEENINNQGLRMKIVEYNNAKNIDVEFENGWIAKNVNYNNQFKIGNIKNPYFPSICGVGYIGEGNYKTNINYKMTKEYECWKTMIRRCYDKDVQKRQPTYIGCTVCDEWHNFQNFAEWYNENYYKIKDETMCLDKDILVKGNKIYSPDTCVFVPKRINSLFVKCDKRRGYLPIGIRLDKRTNKFKAECNQKSKKIHLGEYNSLEDAFQSYKSFKESIIKETADEYKNKIPEKLYNAMYSYQVEIDD